MAVKDNSIMITGWKVVVKGKRVFEHVNVLPCFDYCVLHGLCTKIVRPIKDKTVSKYLNLNHIKPLAK